MNYTRNRSSAARFVLAASNLSGWPIPSHFFETPLALLADVRDLLRTRFGVDCIDAEIAGDELLFGPFEEKSVLEAANWFLPQLSQWDFKTIDRSWESFNAEVSRLIAVYAISSGGGGGGISSERETLFSESIVDYASRKIKDVFAWTNTGGDEWGAGGLCKFTSAADFWFQHPYAYYYLVCLCSFIAGSTRRLYKELSHALPISASRLGNSILSRSLAIRVVSSDYHPASGLIFRVATPGLSDFYVKPRSNRAICLFNKLYHALLQDYGIFKWHDIAHVNSSNYGDLGGLSVEKCVAHKMVYSEDEIALYYQAVGVLVLCAYILDATDLHFENVVASNIPVVIDVESIFYSLVGASSRYDRGGVLASGLLPFSVSGENILKFDLSAIGCINRHRVPFFKRGNSGFVNPTENRVIRPDGSVAGCANYSEAVVGGFSWAARHVIRNSIFFIELVRKHMECGVDSRVYHEPSIAYDTMVGSLTDPIFTSNLPAMNLAIRSVTSRTNGKHPLVIDDERASLSVFGIPRTTAKLCWSQVGAESGKSVSVDTDFINSIRSLDEGLEGHIKIIEKSCRRSIFG